MHVDIRGGTQNSMAINNGLFTSKSDEWTTPLELFEKLNRRFLFDLDAAADNWNHLLDEWYTKEDSGLEHSWEGRRVFCNCPYSQIKLWAAKFVEEANRAECIVALIPARTDTRWWHDHIMTADKIVYIRGRLKFGPGTGSAPFPSALAIWMGLNEL